MKHFQLLLAICFCGALSNAQDANHQFEVTKGKWPSPISRFVRLDTTSRDCRECQCFYASFTSEKPQEVRNIVKGKVAAIFKVADVYAIIITSGDYFVAYTGLSEPSVRKNDTVASGIILGRLMKNQDNDYYQLEVSLMKGKNIGCMHITEWFDWDQLNHSQ